MYLCTRFQREITGCCAPSLCIIVIHCGTGGLTVAPDTYQGNSPMKKMYLLAFVTMLAVSAKAQDTIIFRNGDEQKVKVTEVSDSQIKYRMWSNMNGPVYTKNISDIFMVKYEGGHKEVYGQNQPAQQSQQQYNQYSGNFGQGIMEHDDGNLLLNGRELSDREIRDLLGVKGFETYESAYRQRRAGKALTTVGFIEMGVGIGLFLVDALTDFDFEGAFAIPGLILFTASQIQLPIGIASKAAGNGRLNWLADSYNRNSGQLSQNLSIGFGPSLTCVPTPTGNSYGLGAGIQLNF